MPIMSFLRRRHSLPPDGDSGDNFVDEDDTFVDGSDIFVDDDEFPEDEDDDLSLNGLDDESDHDVPSPNHTSASMCVVSTSAH